MDTTKLPYWIDLPVDRAHSSGDPILRSFQDAERKVFACGGLYYVRGNLAPYFSLTMCSWRRERGRWKDDCFGVAHEELLALWPELAPLAALHMSDCKGEPMHAEANGFYQLAGYAGGLDERFHAGNAETYERHDAETPAQVSERCLRQWAEHMRLPIAEAQANADLVIAAGTAKAQANGYRLADGSVFVNKAIGVAVRNLHAAFVEAQKPRWAREAAECCEALGITYYYGDRWVAEEAIA